MLAVILEGASCVTTFTTVEQTLMLTMDRIETTSPWKSVE